MKMSSGIFLKDTLRQNECEIRSMLEVLRPKLPQKELQMVNSMEETLKDMISYGLTLDYKDIPSNGVRSIVKLSSKSIQVFLHKYKHRKDIDKFMPIIHHLSFCCKLFNLLYKDKIDGRQMFSLGMQGFDEESFRVMHTDFYHHCVPSMKFGLNMLFYIYLFRTKDKIWDVFKLLTLFSRRYLIAEYSRKLHRMKNIEKTKIMIRFGSGYFMSSLLSLLREVITWVKWVPRCRAKYVRIKVPSPFTITVTVAGCELERRPPGSTNDVVFSILRDPSSKNYKNKLLIYAHGGGFIGPDSKTVDNFYVKDWCNMIPGLTILSIDYALAPEEPFPRALLQVCDIYLWASSGRPEVEKVVGFIPDEIVVCGDSAGAQMTMSLAVFLNEIRIAGHEIQMLPASLLLFWPKVTSSYTPHSSMALALIDPLINVYLINTFGRAYVPFKHRDKNGNWKLVQDSYTIPYDFLNREDYELMESPFLSPLLYPKLEDLSAIKLSVMGIEYDPCLDDAVNMCKAWKGQADLRIIPEANHGSYLFHLVSKAGKQVIRTAADMIRESFSHQ